MQVKLGVNVDHIATLRQARGMGLPDPVDAAKRCFAAGADLIVCHLRQDRRHIQDSDVANMRRELRGHIHLEMSCSAEIEKIALKLRPDSVCLVPEGPRELTTQGGLKLAGATVKTVEKMIKDFSKAGIGVSLFIDPDANALRVAHAVGADTVELCTKAYAEAKGTKKQAEELENLEVASLMARELKLHLHSGHGLGYHNVAPVAAIQGMECLNIGFSIISRAVFTGLDKAVADMKEIIVRA
jgi:pyridoxine 5-phosphate synthase